MPALGIARDLLMKTGPLATTSANLSGSPPSLTVHQALKAFPEVPVLGPVPWPVASGEASTVIAWGKGGSWRLLRQGTLIPNSLKKQ